MDTKTIIAILITTVIVAVMFLSCDLLKAYDTWKSNRILEAFTNNRIEDENMDESPAELLEIKKTLNFREVYNNKREKYTIWEPVPIGEYYPIGHYLTIDQEPPKKPAVLVKSQKSESDKPVKFTLISLTEGDKYGIWKPVPKPGHEAMGHIFSKDYPSKHTIRCPSKEHLMPCNLKGTCVESKGYSIWNTDKNGDLLLANSLDNSNIPDCVPHTIQLNKIHQRDLLKLKTTRKYTRIFNKRNTKLNQSVCFWRPVAPEGYVSTGDIVTTNGFNPNNEITSFVVSQDFIQFPKDFGKQLVTLSNKRGKATIWKPNAPDGYTCLGHVITPGEDEPESNQIIGCVPLEYTREYNTKSIKMVYNNIPAKSIFSIHSVPETHHFVVNSGLDSPIDASTVLNKNLMYLDKDCMDYPRDIILDYELNPENTLNYTPKDREKYLVNTLSRRVNVAPNRFQNIRFNSAKKKIHLTIDSRAANSGEMTVGEIVLLVRKLVLEETFKVYSTDYNNHISTLTYIEVMKPRRDKIMLDNSDFKQRRNRGGKGL